MPAPRREMIQALVDGASDGMTPVAAHATEAEVLSAYFTLARHGVEYVLGRTQSVHDREHNREAILKSLLELFTLAGGKGN